MAAPSNWFDLAERAEFSPERLRKVGLCDTPRLLLDIYCLLPGQAQKTHAHEDIDKVYLVLSGRPTVIVGDEERALGPFQGGFAPAGQPHGLRNDGDGPATVLVVQARGRAPRAPERALTGENHL